MVGFWLNLGKYSMKRKDTKPVKIEISGSIAEDICAVVTALACLAVAVLSALIEIIQEVKDVLKRRLRRY